MKPPKNILDSFPKHLFWDVNPKALDLNKDIQFIIPRSLIATTKDTFDKDISKLETFYSQNQIIDALKSTKERISNTICAMIADRYNIQPFLRFQR